MGRRSIEPEWWLRAQLRQLAHILGRTGTGGLPEWTLWLNSKSLPDEPPWRIRAGT